MFIEKFIISFWQGKMKLWQSFWLVGGIGGIIITQIIIFIEEIIFSNPIESPLGFSLRGKILVLIWIIYSTTGIWRSAEKYKESTLSKIAAKIYVTINCLSSILLLFFFDFSAMY